MAVVCPTFVNSKIKKKHIHIQAGTAVIGPNLVKGQGLGATVDEVFQKANIEFPQEFSCPPFVTANTLQDPNIIEPLRDTFAVSIVKVDTKKFTVNVKRVDTLSPCSITQSAPPLYTWAQNLRLSWTAIGPVVKGCIKEPGVVEAKFGAPSSPSSPSVPTLKSDIANEKKVSATSYYYK